MAMNKIQFINQVEVPVSSQGKSSNQKNSASKKKSKSKGTLFDDLDSGSQLSDELNYNLDKLLGVKYEAFKSEIMKFMNIHKLQYQKMLTDVRTKMLPSHNTEIKRLLRQQSVVQQNRNSVSPES